MSHVRQLLDETAAYQAKGFEWYYRQRQAHQELRTLRGHFGPVFGVAFSPDGERIVTGSNVDGVKMWDAATGRPLHTLATGDGWIWTLAWSPNQDQETLAVGTLGGNLQMWDPETGQQRSSLQAQSR